MTTSAPLHVVPDRRGGWHVQREGETRPLSDHASATEAESAAIGRTVSDEVVVHDRYGRIHRAQRVA